MESGADSTGFRSAGLTETCKVDAQVYTCTSTRRALQGDAGDGDVGGTPCLLRCDEHVMRLKASSPHFWVHIRNLTYNY
jgi:hypothetical protein